MALRRRYRRRYRNKGRWSSNITKIRMTGTALPGQIFGDTFTVAQNPVQSSTTVSQQYTVKNIEITGELESNNLEVEDITYYIMYVPEGYPIDLNLPYNHPEWIMAYKYVGSAFDYSAVSSSNAQVPKIKTRLARKLNSGDSIIFMIRGHNYSTSTNVEYSGLVRWWTKAN